MLGEQKTSRLNQLLAGVSAAALAMGVIAIAPSAAQAQEIELDDGATLADGTAYNESDADNGGTIGATITGVAVNLGTTGDAANDAIEVSSTGDVTVTDNTTAGAIEFDGRLVTSSTGSLTINLGAGNDADDAQTIVFRDNVVEGTGAISIVASDTTNTDVLTFQFDSTAAALQIDASIADTATGDTAIVQTQGANNVSFTDTVSVDAVNVDTNTTFGGAVTTAATTGGIDVATGVSATFTDTATVADDVTVNGTGALTVNGGQIAVTDDFGFGTGTFTVNSTAATAFDVDGNIVLGAGTLHIDANVEDTDTVFDVAGTFTGGGIDVTIDEGFHTGTIILETGDAADDSGEFTLAAGQADGALANYTIVNNAGATELRAATKTAATIAAEQGVSEEYGAGAIQAAAAIEAGGSVTEEDTFGAALSAGGDTTSNAIASAGSQSDVIGGGVESAMAGNSASQDVVFARTAALRSDGASFASADTGFAAGDHVAVSGEFWIRGFGGIADADTDGGDPGFEATFGGVVVGVDFDLDQSAVVGVFAGYSISDVDGDGAGSAELESEGFQIGLYYSRSEADYYVDVTVGYTYVQNDSDRFITATSATASADYDAHVISGALEIGAPMEVQANTFFTPVVGLSVTHYSAEDYTETGGGALNQSVDSDAVTEVVGTIGFKAHYVYDADGFAVIPELRAAAGYDFADEEATAAVNYTGGGAAYNVTGTDLDPFRAEVGAGVGFAFEDEVTLSLNYDGDLRSDYQSHAARVDLRIGF